MKYPPAPWHGSACDWVSLIPEKVKGKIVYCLGDNGQDFNIRDLGGVGTIMSPDVTTDIAYTFVIPATLVTYEEGKKIDKYINSTKYVSLPIQLIF